MSVRWDVRAGGMGRDGVMRQGWKEREVAPASVDRRKILRVSSLGTIGTIKG